MVYVLNKSTIKDGLGVSQDRTVLFDSSASLRIPLVALPEGDIKTNQWSYAAASGGILNTTTAVTIKTAAGVGLRNYITDIQIVSENLGTKGELVVRDGAGGTVLWRIQLVGPMALPVSFRRPLRGSANTLLEVATLTASGTGAVWVNAQGYFAA